MSIAMMNEIAALRARIEELERQVQLLAVPPAFAQPQKTLHIPTNKDSHGQTRRS